jgi:hypothetical protein
VLGVDGLDDFGLVDALQVGGGDAEVGVAELALDDDQRHTFTCHLDRMGVPELVWCEAPADICRDGRPAQVRSGGGARPRSAARGTVDDAEPAARRAIGPAARAKGASPPSPMGPFRVRGGVRPCATDEQRASAVIQIGFGERECFLDAQPCAPQDHDQAAAGGRGALAGRMTAMISSMGGSAG